MSARIFALALALGLGLVVAPVAPVASADHYCGEICIDYHQVENLKPFVYCLYQKVVKNQPCA